MLAAPRVQGFALAHAIALNEALQVLRDPKARACYLLSVLPTAPAAIPVADGIPINGGDSELTLLEHRTALTELDGLDTHVELSRVEHRLVRRYEAVLAELAVCLDGRTLDAATHAKARNCVAALGKLREAVDDIDAQVGDGRLPT